MYQDVWINGEVTEKGERECAPRYEALRQVCYPLEPGFSVLDLGANAGYFGLRLAAEFDAKVTFADDYSRLPEIVAANAKGGKVIPRRLSPRDLDDLGRFDVVLAYSVLHHYADWEGAALQLLSMGRQVIIEVPGREEIDRVINGANSPLIHDWLAARGPSIICESPSYLGNGGIRPNFCFSSSLRVGTVRPGCGATAMQFHQYKAALEAVTGRLYRGTLNLILDRPLELSNPITVQSRYGDIRLYRGTIGTSDCWFARMPLARPEPESLEVFARDRLRDAYSLADGDRIVVTARPEHL